MKLGKALATGVAEEQPRIHEEELELPEETENVENVGDVQDVVDIEASAPEEVPAAR
ncbi:hypothetical protein OG895_07705 [Streptomyces sp. NBC_00201]|uniref:hypothetical protein n=1 Tax=unclassified Streptomyces TaxID=2593676 RepID=UPI00225BDE5D|nr:MULTISPECIES: hypothetical protein [unclassified Streptomyces]MCX5047309.1 hypothetical protein [Streptomyces sp. NBC_00474]MCX5057995.1 hypothetical protein [Streptomyces sp. NBC_00452]MCX5245128.1 hypothetical protein [Streptomyces sp. NBC_00201]MCX5289142.1 hypothetical protein [Streptomyces sp. NBC_00183]